MLNLKESEIIFLLIYYILGITILIVGALMVYDKRTATLLSSSLLSLGFFLVVVIPISFLAYIAIQSEFSIKPDSIVDYISNLSVYRDAFLIMLFILMIYSFFQFSFYVFDVDNLQNVDKIPQFIKDKKCGILCFPNIQEMFMGSRGAYKTLDIFSIAFSSLIAITPFMLFFSSLNTLSNLGIGEALIGSSLRILVTSLIAIFVLFGMFTGFKEVLDMLIKEGYWGGIMMSLINLGFFYFYFTILTGIYLFISNSA